MRRSEGKSKLACILPSGRIWGRCIDVADVDGPNRFDATRWRSHRRAEASARLRPAWGVPPQARPERGFMRPRVPFGAAPLAERKSHGCAAGRSLRALKARICRVRALRRLRPEPLRTFVRQPAASRCVNSAGFDPTKIAQQPLSAKTKKHLSSRQKEKDAFR